MERTKPECCGAILPKRLAETAVFTLNTQLCRGALYKSALAAAQIPVYDSVLYEGGVALSDYENCIRIGKELQPCGKEDDVNEIVTRREAAMLLHDRTGS